MRNRKRVVRQLPVLLREAGIRDELTEFLRPWMSAMIETQPELLAYLAYMAERLLWIKGTIKPTGSIYLHCDCNCQPLHEGFDGCHFWT